MFQSFPGIRVFSHKNSRKLKNRGWTELLLAVFSMQCLADGFERAHKGYKHLQTTESQLNTDVQGFRSCKKARNWTSRITDLLHHAGMIS
jgi:hypothetical protein